MVMDNNDLDDLTDYIAHSSTYTPTSSGNVPMTQHN